MKQRVLTGCVIAVFFVLWMLCMNTPFFCIFLAFLSGMAVYEIHRAAGIKNIPLLVLSLCVSCLFPFVTNELYSVETATALHLSAETIAVVKQHLSVVLIVYVILSLIFMLARFQKTRFEHVAISIFSALAVPFSFSCLLFLRDFSAGNVGREPGIFLILFSFTCSWFTDIFAYLTGRAFGKHKLCPTISPKKTVEGAVGGVLVTMVVNIVMLLVFNKFFAQLPFPIWFTAVLSVLLSVISMCGDLSASTIKRNYGIKDFGKLLPGHGGIMDRFDSCLFVWPCLYGLVQVGSFFLS